MTGLHTSQKEYATTSGTNRKRVQTVGQGFKTGGNKCLIQMRLLSKERDGEVGQAYVCLDDVFYIIISYSKYKGPDTGAFLVSFKEIIKRVG